MNKVDKLQTITHNNINTYKHGYNIRRSKKEPQKQF